MTSGLVEALDRLCAITEAQLVAAKALDRDRLEALNDERRDIVFDLRVWMQDAPEGVDKTPAVQEAMARLQHLDERLLAVSSMVLTAVGAGHAPTTYDAKGRVRGSP